MCDSQHPIKKPLVISEIDKENGIVRTYMGCILFRPNQNKQWIVKFGDDNHRLIIPTKSFSTLPEAITHKKEQSDRLCLTTTRNASLCEMGVDIPLSKREFIIGFIDGDGCVNISETGSRVFCYQSSSGDSPNILKDIQSIYGGRMYSSKSKNPKQRKRYVLEISETQYGPYILNDICKHSILKAHMAKDALTFSQSSSIVERQKLWEKNKSDHTNFSYQRVSIDQDRITWPYIAGLFDSDGSLGLYNGKPRLEIAQKISPQLLYSILSFSGCTGGIINNERMQLQNASSIITFISNIIEHVVQKLDQCQLLIYYLLERDQCAVSRKRQKTNDWNIEQSLININKEVESELKRLKRL